MLMNLHHHWNLLQRWEQGLALREAIQRVVKPGMRVLDAGCGTGLLSLWAAQAGAQVVGVDKTEVDLARRLAAVNGLSDKARFLQGDLLELDAGQIGGKCDLVMAMIYHNDPRRDETAARISQLLHRRFLKPGGERIPDRVQYTAMACEWGEQDVTTHLHQVREDLETLQGRYGIKFHPLYDDLLAQPNPAWFPERRADGKLVKGTMRQLSPATPFAETDYRTNAGVYPNSLELKIEAPGVMTAVLWTQRLFHRKSLIFVNESVGWLWQPRRVTTGETVALLLEDIWRKTNILAFADRPKITTEIPSVGDKPKARKRRTSG